MSHFERKVYTRKLPLKNVFTISRSSRTHVENIFIELSKDGVTGYGEAHPNSRYDESPEQVVGELKALPAEILEEAETAEALAELLDRHLNAQSGKAAVEMAWMDWKAKTKGIPLWKSYGHENPKSCVTSYTIGIDTPEVMRRKVRDASEYPVYKIKLGTDHDRELIQAIREETDHILRVDANEGWTSVDQAKREIEFLAEQNVELIEQPMPSAMFREMAELKKWSPLPLCADESFIGGEDPEELAEAFDILNIKLMKIGSLAKAGEVIRKAHALNMEIMIGCMIESSLANAAGALVALDAGYADLDGHLLISEDPFSGLSLSEGKEIILSDKPGLGVEPVSAK